MTQTPKALRIANAEYRIQELERDLAAANERAERYREALQEIKGTCGKVCSGFELCTHVACSSSYGAWAIADAALAQPQETGAAPAQDEQP